MSAGAGKPQEQPRWEEKFSQMFVIVLNAVKPDTRSSMSLNKERDFVSSAEGLCPEKDVSFPDYCLCGLKRSSALTVLPVFGVRARQLCSSCRLRQQGAMEAVLETSRCRGVLSSDTALNSGERSQAAAAAPDEQHCACGSTAHSSGWSVNPDLRRSRELSGLAGRMRERGRAGHENWHPDCSPEGVVETTPCSSPCGNTDCEIANPKLLSVTPREEFRNVVQTKITRIHRLSK